MVKGWAVDSEFIQVSFEWGWEYLNASEGIRPASISEKPERFARCKHHRRFRGDVPGQISSVPVVATVTLIHGDRFMKPSSEAKLPLSPFIEISPKGWFESKYLWEC